MIIKFTSVNISRVYFRNLNDTIPNIISMPSLPFYYKLNQKCLYSADLHLVEFLKIWDFWGIWNMIQIFPNLCHTGNEICTIKFIVGKNKFIPYIHQEVMFLVHLFICLSLQLLQQYSPLYTNAARRDAARLNKIEIMEVVHCLYICAARHLAVQRRFFYLENFLIFFKNRTAFFTIFPKFSLIFRFHTG